MSKLVENGQTVNLHYVGTFNDGEQFDSSHDREEVLSVVVGAGQLIKGFDAALVGMTVGETKTSTIISVLLNYQRICSPKRYKSP